MLKLGDDITLPAYMPNFTINPDTNAELQKQVAQSKAAADTRNTTPRAIHASSAAQSKSASDGTGSQTDNTSAGSEMAKDSTKSDVHESRLSKEVQDENTSGHIEKATHKQNEASSEKVQTAAKPVEAEVDVVRTDVKKGEKELLNTSTSEVIECEDISENMEIAPSKQNKESVKSKVAEEVISTKATSEKTGKAALLGPAKDGTSQQGFESVQTGTGSCIEGSETEKARLSESPSLVKPSKTLSQPSDPWQETNQQGSASVDETMRHGKGSALKVAERSPERSVECKDNDHSSHTDSEDSKVKEHTMQIQEAAQNMVINDSAGTVADLTDVTLVQGMAEETLNSGIIARAKDLTDSGGVVTSAVAELVSDGRIDGDTSGQGRVYELTLPAHDGTPMNIVLPEDIQAVGDTVQVCHADQQVSTPSSSCVMQTSRDQVLLSECGDIQYSDPQNSTQPGEFQVSSEMVKEKGTVDAVEQEVKKESPEEKSTVDTVSINQEVVDSECLKKQTEAAGPVDHTEFEEEAGQVYYSDDDSDSQMVSVVDGVDADEVNLELAGGKEAADTESGVGAVSKESIERVKQTEQTSNIQHGDITSSELMADGRDGDGPAVKPYNSGTTELQPAGLQTRKTEVSRQQARGRVDGIQKR